MTVSTTTTKAIYNGDGSTTAFPTTFEFFDAADIEVIERVIATGAETVKTLSTDYTVSGGNGATGTVTAVTAPASTGQWAIRRKTPLTQQIDYVENDDFPAETHEEGLDRAVMIAQERQEELDRALKFPVSDATSLDPEIPNSVDRAGQFLAFDANGDPIASAGPVGETPVSAFMQTLLDDADAAGGRATLETEGVKASAIASAATTDIWGATGDLVHITGTTTITSFGTASRAGIVREVIFDGALTLTHGAQLDLPGTANITTAAGDRALVRADTTTKAVVMHYQRADGTAVVSSGDGLLQSVQVFTTTGGNTWTKPAGLKRIRVQVQAGGGGGGGCASTAAGEGSEGGSGGGGGYTEELIEESALGATETATVGAGGPGGSAGANNGTAGSTSSFGALCSATGGGFGLGSVASSGGFGHDGGLGGIGSGGDFNVRGGFGGSGQGHSSGQPTRKSSGGSSHLGGNAGEADRETGPAGSQYGGGGSGGSNTQSQSARAGGAGADGVIIVWEYF